MKIRKQTFSLEQYLKLMNNETIRTDAEVQRLSGQWGSSVVSALIYTVLTDNYIPPVILGEQTTNNIISQWIIDGLQRSTSLDLFRYGGVKVSRNIDEYMVTYQKKVVDENGVIVRDSNGAIVWENVDFDIRGKSYNALPEELQDRFNQYQLDTVIHQNCTSAEVSKLIRIYNNMKPMTKSQTSFCFIDNFASDIRDITKHRFFTEIYKGTAKDRINGTFERIVGDIVTWWFYPEHYKKDIKKGFKWLNENATLYDFDMVHKMLDRVMVAVGNDKEISNLFDRKNVGIFVSVIGKQAENMTDSDINGFLKWFVSVGANKEIDNLTWKDINLDRSTRDSTTIQRKLNYLNSLIDEYMEMSKAA